MPTVPSYGVPQVQARNLPNVRISDAPARDIAVAGQAMAQGVNALATATQRFVEHEQRKADTATQMRVENELAALENATLHDPEKGALARRGEDAFDLPTKVMPDWDRRAADIVNGVPRHLQEWAQGQAQARRTAAERRLMSHTLQQSNAYALQQGTALQANAQNAALLNYTDPKRVDEEIARGMVAVDRLLDLGGADEITRQNARAAYVSQTQRKVLERAILDDPLAARTRLAQIRERLTGEDQAALDEQLSAIEDDLQGDLDARWAEAGGPMPFAFIDGPSDGRPAPSVPTAIRSVIEAAADRYGVPRHLALAMAQQESGFKPDAVGPETKWGRARGLYQYLDDTARGLGIDPTNPEQAADAAMRQLAEQAAAKGWDWAIAHHHAGPDRKQHGPKTRSYVAQVKEKARRFQSGAPAPADVGGPAGSLAEALERLQSIPDPARRKAAEAKVRDRFAIRAARDKEALAEIEDGIYSKVAAADPSVPLRKVLTPQELAFAARSESLMAGINRFRKEAAAGPVIEDDPATVDELFRLQAIDPKRFASVPLARYSSRLTGKTLSEFAKTQAGIRKDGQGSAESREYASLDQQLRVAYQKLGWPTDDEDHKEHRGKFLSAYLTLAREFTETQKRKPTADERDKLIASLLVKKATVQGGKRTGPRQALWERLGTVPPIDAGTRQQIVEAWQSVNGRNRMPTEQQIFALYFMEHGAPE